MRNGSLCHLSVVPCAFRSILVGAVLTSAPALAVETSGGIAYTHKSAKGVGFDGGVLLVVFPASGVLGSGYHPPGWSDPEGNVNGLAGRFEVGYLGTKGGGSLIPFDLLIGWESGRNSGFKGFVGAGGGAHVWKGADVPDAPMGSAFVLSVGADVQLALSNAAKLILAARYDFNDKPTFESKDSRGNTFKSAVDLSAARFSVGFIFDWWRS